VNDKLPTTIPREFIMNSESAAAVGANISFTDVEVLKCPVAAYRRLHEEAPVHLDPVTGMYYVTRFADIRKIALDPRTFSNDTQLLSARQTPATERITAMYAEIDVTEVNTLVTNDPPSHRSYRALVDMAFRDQRITAIEPRIQEIANDLIDAFPGDAFDFVKAFAIPLPIRMIAEQLGVPPTMIDTFKRWSDATIESTDPRLAPDRQIELAAQKREMFEFFLKHRSARQNAPDDTMISDIANAQYDGRPLNPSEFCGIMIQLLVGGNETTTSALASGAYYLATRPDLQDELRADPDKVRAFVEEVLRLEAPLAGLYRRATKAVAIGGVDIPEGAILHLRWAAGNRDEERFPNAAEIDLERANAAQHLAFGAGIHYCLGNQLARAELYHGFRALLSRSRAITLSDDPQPVERLLHFFAQGPIRLQVRFDRA